MKEVQSYYLDISSMDELILFVNDNLSREDKFFSSCLMKFKEI